MKNNKENFLCILYLILMLLNFLTLPNGIWTVNRWQWNYSKFQSEFYSKKQPATQKGNVIYRNFWKSHSVSWFFLTKFTTSGAVTCFTYHKRWLVFWPIFAASKLPMFLFEQKRQKLTAPEFRAQNVHQKIPSKQHRKKIR